MNKLPSCFSQDVISNLVAALTETGGWQKKPWAVYQVAMASKGGRITWPLMFAANLSLYSIDQPPCRLTSCTAFFKLPVKRQLLTGPVMGLQPWAGLQQLFPPQAWQQAGMVMELLQIPSIKRLEELLTLGRKIDIWISMFGEAYLPAKQGQFLAAFKERCLAASQTQQSAALHAHIQQALQQPGSCPDDTEGEQQQQQEVQQQQEPSRPGQATPSKSDDGARTAAASDMGEAMQDDACTEAARKRKREDGDASGGAGGGKDDVTGAQAADTSVEVPPSQQPASQPPPRVHIAAAAQATAAGASPVEAAAAGHAAMTRVASMSVGAPPPATTPTSATAAPIRASTRTAALASACVRAAVRRASTSASAAPTSKQAVAAPSAARGAASTSHAAQPMVHTGARGSRPAAQAEDSDTDTRPVKKTCRRHAEATLPPAPAGFPSEGLRIDKDGTVNMTLSGLSENTSNMSRARSSLASWGVVGMRPAVSNTITPEDASACGRMTLQFGKRIFDKPQRGAAGELVRDSKGHILMDYGLRTQLHLDPVKGARTLKQQVSAYSNKQDVAQQLRQQAKEDAATAYRLRRRLQPAAAKIAQQVIGAQLGDCVILANDTEDGVSCSEQEPHCDTKRPGSGVIIWALSYMCLLVWPLSHIAVRSEERWDKPQLANQHELVDALLPSEYKRVRLWLAPGDVVAMLGHTIHAGDAGTPNQPAARLHFYVGVQGDKNTYPLAAMHMRKKFAGYRGS